MNKITNETVTILVPTYRRPNSLKRAIDSILQQTHTDFEIIISDNHSSDGTKGVVNEYLKKDPRVCYYEQDTNIGMNANFNFLLSKVTTPYFCMLTDDDYYKDNFLKDAINGLKRHNTAMFSIMSCPTISASGELIKNQLDKWTHKGFCKKKVNTYLFLTGSHPIITGIVFKREILSDVYFEEKFGNTSDIPLLVRLSLKYDFYASSKVGLYFVRHAGVIGNQSKSERLIIKEKINIISEYEKLISDNVISNYRKLKWIIFKKKLIVLGRINKNSIPEGRVVVGTLNQPLRYVFMAHLYLLHFMAYDKFIEFIRKIFIHIIR